ncbi:MAG: phosphate ABC transporter permease PstA [Deltaproteobacteria bacterium]|nr:phosphate ABC transporter permease PstA [Deltaproteobacteria bacterium]
MAFLGLFILFIIIKDVFIKGIDAINIDFFTENMRPAGIKGGGVKNAIYGTLMITLISSIIGIPVGVSAGVYLSEWGRDTILGKVIRFGVNILMGVPSIIIGIFIYALIITRIKHGSGIAGALALSIIMVPVISRTTEDMLRMVPDTLRESALALGTPRWKITVSILFRAAKSGMITGVLLSIARVSGETAPLIFTARFSQFWPENLNSDTANLTMTIYNYAPQPYNDLVQIAWGASLLIMGGVLIITIGTRMLFSDRLNKYK